MRPRVDGTCPRLVARPPTSSPIARRGPVALALALAAVALLPARPATADEEEKIASYAVQNRRFQLGHEFQAAVGVLPLDAFTKGLTVGGGYTYHFSQLWAWEVLQGAYSIGLDTGLKNELLENFQVEPTELDALQYFLSTSLVLKPLYGKFAWMNDKVVHAEISLSSGAGVGKYEYAAYRAGLDVGAGLRLFLGTGTSLRLDVRDYGFFALSLSDFSVKQELHVTLAIAFSLGGP